jgi:ABC-type dipeptide/oligopeptide/nickel transport system permease component
MKRYLGRQILQLIPVSLSFLIVFSWYMWPGDPSQLMLPEGAVKRKLKVCGSLGPDKRLLSVWNFLSHLTEGISVILSG